MKISVVVCNGKFSALKGEDEFYNSFFSFSNSFNDDESNLSLMTNSMRKENFEDIQEEHRKILETIESALHKLNSVILFKFQKFWKKKIEFFFDRGVSRNEHIFLSNII